MFIVGINSSHNASIALMENENLIFHLESERLNNIKYNSFCLNLIPLIKKFTNKIDFVGVCSNGTQNNFISPNETTDPYTSMIFGLGNSFYNNDLQIVDFSCDHHFMHASCAFYNSGFKEAICIVKDGAGSKISFGEYLNSSVDLVGREAGTTFFCSYPNNFQVIDKAIYTNLNLPKNKYFLDENIYLTNSISEAMAFQTIAKLFDFHPLDAGKVMGMSAYGTNIKIPKLYVDGLINTNLFNVSIDSPSKPYFSYNFKNTFEEKSNIAFELQKQSEENVFNYILEMIEKTNQKNVCLTGGFFLNCVANYKILQKMPKDINIYIEPISNDAGTAIGSAKYIYYSQTKNKNIKKQSSVFYGLKHSFKKNYFKNVKVHKNIDEKYVAQLLSKRKIVALYQGMSESGPRALGNRSILYDPTDKNGKNVINKIKKREWFRPFAGTVLLEHAKEWFDLDKLKESPFMMYAVNTLKEKQDIVSGIVHVDGTCRIQTITQQQNKVFYNIINEFYKITNVPVLLNTSFNLAGECMVETIPQAISTLNRSEIDYLYFPEKQILVEKNV